MGAITDPPDPIVSADLWRLGARPDALTWAAGAWRDLARCVSAAGDDVATATGALLATWRDSAATAYRPHRQRLLATFAAVSTVADDIAAVMDDAAGAVRTAQSHLDDCWWRLRRGLAPGGRPVTLTGGRVVFHPVDGAEVALVHDAIAEAGDIHACASARLGALGGQLTGLRLRLPIATTGWLTDLPPESTVAGERFIVDADRVIVNATGAGDDIRITVDAGTGEQIVAVDGTVTRVPAGARLIVRAGGGDDTITVAPGSAVRVTLLAGAGDDTVTGGDGADTILGLWGRDTVRSGGGSDRVSGGAGSDYLDGQYGDDRLDGGPGDDTVYGLDGADRLSGGTGRDYLDGGPGPDQLAAGAAQDVLMGGRGADVLAGGGGDDVLYAGPGTDRLRGGGGADRAFSQADDVVHDVDRDVTVVLRDVGGFIGLEGSPEFVARVQSDLDALRSSERGSQMLAALQESHQDSRPAAADLPWVGSLFSQANTLVIREMGDANGFTRTVAPPLGPVAASIDYTPAFDDLGANPPVPPIVVLYHELAHVYDAFYDTSAPGNHVGADNPGVPNLEREAVGLPVDHDRDPTTADQLYPGHPGELTENGLREEFGLRPREHY